MQSRCGPATVNEDESPNIHLALTLGKEETRHGQKVPLRSQETCPGYIAISAENRNHAPDLGTISLFNSDHQFYPRARE